MILATVTQSDIDSTGPFTEAKKCVMSRLIERVTGERVFSAGITHFGTKDKSGNEHHYECGINSDNITEDFSIRQDKQSSFGKLVSIEILK